MDAANQILFQKLSGREVKFIKSLRLKKYRQQENVFVIEGAKNIAQLINSSHPIQMLIGTPAFLAGHRALWQDSSYRIFQTDERTLTSLGMLTTNNAALAVAPIPIRHREAPSTDAWGLVLDNISDPGNLGTIVRIADWYNIPALVCSLDTVDLYNPKALQASMSSFLRVQMHYTDLPTFLNSTPQPIIGTFTQGDNLHHTTLPSPGWIVIGNESRGISSAVLPYIRQRITIPRYGQAESLNAAMATAIICDRWRHP